MSFAGAGVQRTNSQRESNIISRDLLTEAILATKDNIKSIKMCFYLPFLKI